ncbi:MAG: hypothetical protein ACFFG0_32075 [Candidatus Thorarchaeota archaeon]
MIKNLRKLDKEILQYLYQEINSSEEYYHNFTIEDIRNNEKFNTIRENEIIFSVEQLNKSGFIKIRPFPQKIDFRISLDGILFIEEQFLIENKIFTSFTIKILNFLKKVQDGIIELNTETNGNYDLFPTKEIFEEIDCQKENEKYKISFILNEIINYSFSDKESLIYTNTLSIGPNEFHFFSKVILTARGRAFLDYHQKLKNLFRSINDNFAKEILLDEYKEIENLRIREKWKDAFIKIASILECLITFYIEQNNLDKDKDGKIIKTNVSIAGRKRRFVPSEGNFEEKLNFIMQYEIFGREYNSYWEIVNSLIRNFRNYVHLLTYIKKRIKVDKELFDKLYPVFEKLIILF